MEYATEQEMIDHCDQYACVECPISERCSMFENLIAWGNSWLPLDEDNEKLR